MWIWSETFAGILEGLIREPQLDRAMRWSWAKHPERLAQRRQQVESARELYQRGETEALRVLHDFWRTIADDVREQARIACETYHQLHFRRSA